MALRGTAPGDKAAAVAAMRAWLLRQDWAGVIRRAPAAPGEMFVVSSWGNVGLVVPPPFACAPTLAIFDPMQLRRLAPSFQSALAAAHASPPLVASPQTAAAVLDFLRAKPWPPGTEFREPTLDQAAADLRRQYKQFLAREPYVRPEGHDIPDGE